MKKPITDYLNTYLYIGYFVTHRHIETTIFPLFISDCQSSVGKAFEAFKQYVYDVLLTESKHTVNRIKPCSSIIRNSSCNFCMSDVDYSCTELTTFKTSNLKERRLKKWV